MRYQTLVFCHFYRKTCYLTYNMNQASFFICCQTIWPFLGIVSIFCLFPLVLVWSSPSPPGSPVLSKHHRWITEGFSWISHLSSEFAYNNLYPVMQFITFVLPNLLTIYVNNTNVWVNIAKSIENFTKNPIMGV